MPHEQVVEEERRTRKRHRDLAKARKVRKRKAETEVWRKVKEYRKLTDCKCDLRPGMTWTDLLELGSGCTGLDNGGQGWVCPALDIYRSLVKR